MKDGNVISKPGWAFSVRRDGPDLRAEGLATCFGGYDDAGDDGDTASGLPTRQRPEPLGCALAVLPQVKSTAGSPWPRLPWGTVVEVTCGDTIFHVPLIDNGPSKGSGNLIDLTKAAAQKIDPRATANDFDPVRVSIRVLDGARYLPVEKPRGPQRGSRGE